MRVREIPVNELCSLKGADWVDRNRRTYLDGNIAFVPVREGCPCTSTLPQRRPYQGRGYFMLGDVAVFHGRRPG